MRKTLASLFACLTCFPVFAQYEKILADPSISWAAEIELLITPEENYERWPYDSLNATTVLKTVSTVPEDSPERAPQILPEHLFEMMSTGRWPAFADAQLTRPLNPDECLDRYCERSDNHAFDPEGRQTPLTKLQEVRLVCPPSEVYLVKVRQLLVYHDKTANFDLFTRAIALAAPDGRALFWLAVPPSDPKKRPRLDERDIIWARRLRTRGATPNVSQLHVLQRPDFPLLRNFLSRVRTDPKVPVVEANDWRPITLPEREAIFSSVDTVITFDPETYEEKVMVVPRNLNPEDLDQLRLVQDWYWDDRRHRLITRLVAVAPMIDVRDAEGNFRYSRPLFYRKIK